MDGRSPRRVFIAGVGLVVIGGLFSLLSTGRSAFPRYMPAIAGIVTCVAAVATKLPGLLLPGALFLGAGVGLLVAREMPQTEAQPIIGTFLLSVGTSLCLIPPVMKVSGWDFVWWPFVSGGTLALHGLSMLLLNGTDVGDALGAAWPAVVAFSVAWIAFVYHRRRL